VSGVQTLNLSSGLTLTPDQFNGLFHHRGHGHAHRRHRRLKRHRDLSNNGTPGTDSGAPVVTADISTLPRRAGTAFTLVGNNTAGQTLEASLFGDDSLFAGNGAGDALYAGEGVGYAGGGTGATRSTR